MDKRRAFERVPIQAGERLFKCLELLAENKSTGLMEAATALELHKSTVHRLFKSLMQLGYVKQVDGRYALTYKLVHLANKIMHRTDIVQLVRPNLWRLMEKSKETVHLVEREGTEAVYIDKVESMENGIQLVSRIGSRIPLYCSGVGKAMAAEMEEEEVRILWKNSTVRPLTPKTITNYRAFRRDLEKIRREGFAIDDEENEAGIRCVACSLWDGRVRGRYAISISAPISRMEEGRIRQLAGWILETEKEIAQKIALS